MRDPYAELDRVLREARDQASDGKGHERHATPGEAFEDQQIVQLAEWMGNGGFPIGQACKKAIESTRLPYEGARRELLGAIVYLAAEVIRLDRRGDRARRHQGDDCDCAPCKAERAKWHPMEGA
jgi:hypothetical protein